MFFTVMYTSEKRMEGSLLPQPFEFNVVLSWAYFCFYTLFRNGENALAASILKSVLEFPE